MIAITGSSDGDFGSDTIYDYATVVYRETLSPLSIAPVSNGVRLRFSGVPGRNYDLLRANDINGPWESITTITAPASGVIEYTNTPTAMTFYRTASLP